MQVNAALTGEKTLDTYEEISNHPKLKDLKAGILYVPEMLRSNFQWDEPLDKSLNGYKFKYQFITDAELESRILSGEQFYYLQITYLNPFLSVSVADSKTGEVIFRSKRLSKGKIDLEIEKLSKALSKS